MWPVWTTGEGERSGRGECVARPWDATDEALRAAVAARSRGMADAMEETRRPGISY